MKILAGLLASLLIGWIWHGPLGNGERLVDGLEAQARQVVAATEVPGIRVVLSRDPLARVALLSGPANDFQREGLGSFKGITGRVAEVEGLASVRWTDEPGSDRRVVPLLAETLALVALAYIVGLGLGWLLWGRRRREGYA